MANIALGQVEPQIYAGPDLAGRFLNAWQMGQNVRLKELGLQQEMTQMALREENIKYERDFNERKFDWEKKKGGAVNDLREAGLSLREQQLDFNRNKWLESIKEKEDALSQERGFEQYMVNCGKTFGDPGYEDCVRRGQLIYPKAPIDQERLFRTHAATIDQREKSSQEEEKRLLGEFGSKNLANPMFNDPRVILDPDANTYLAYETEPTDQAKAAGKLKTNPMPRGAPGEGTDWKFKVDPNTGGYIKADGRVVPYMGPDPNNVNLQVKKFAFVPNPDLDAAHTQLQDIYKRRTEIPARGAVTTDRTTPGIEVYTQADRDALLPGTRYFIRDQQGNEHWFVK